MNPFLGFLLLLIAALGLEGVIRLWKKSFYILALALAATSIFLGAISIAFFI